MQSVRRAHRVRGKGALRLGLAVEARSRADLALVLGAGRRRWGLHAISSAMVAMPLKSTYVVISTGTATWRGRRRNSLRSWSASGPIGAGCRSPGRRYRGLARSSGSVRRDQPRSTADSARNTFVGTAGTSSARSRRPRCAMANRRRKGCALLETVTVPSAAIVAMADVNYFYHRRHSLRRELAGT